MSEGVIAHRKDVERVELKQKLQKATDALEEALDALHNEAENHPVLTRPAFSKDGDNLWTVLAYLRLTSPKKAQA